MRPMIRIAAVLMCVATPIGAVAKAVSPPEAKAEAPRSDSQLVAQLIEKARKAGQSKDRKTFTDCLGALSRTLFGKVFPEASWEPVGVEGRKNLRLIELHRHDAKPWGMAVIPAKDGIGKDALFVRKEGGRWALDQQHDLLIWDTVQAIMRAKKGEKREKGALAAPTLLPRQLGASSGLPEGWSAEDPVAEDDWSHLPGVQEAFNQKLRGPREKNIDAKFLLFADAGEAEWELWRRKMEFGLKDDLAEKQPSFGDGSAFGKHSTDSFELLLRKGSTLLILFSNSEDVLPIGQRVWERL